MVSKQTTIDPNSNIFHHFLIPSSDPTNTQNFNPYLTQANEFDIMGQENSLFGAQNDAYSLSLSLASQHLVPALNYNYGAECSFMGTNDFASINHSPSYSRYLKPTQSLLEESANVRGSLESSDISKLFFRGANSSELKTQLITLSSASKNEHQIKLSELISLLEQVERKYGEYCNRMEETVTSFEEIAGEGSANCYTSLAQEAMCRHFSSLREAIMVQIKAATKKLCQNSMNIQRLGLMQQCQRQTWRPIRGLPETSVAILRAWLFEHFLNPYPNDSEKLMLSSQTGLTKNQVSNWFINARVRFWKPMIEEMYAEEFGESSSPIDSSDQLDPVVDQ